MILQSWVTLRTCAAVLEVYRAPRHAVRFTGSHHESRPSSMAKDLAWLSCCRRPHLRDLVKVLAEEPHHAALGAPSRHGF